MTVYVLYIHSVRAFSSFAPTARQDSHQVTPSLVGRNILRVYGRSAQTVCRTETVLAVLLSFLLWSLRCISLLHIRFHCQVGILVLEIAEIAFIPIGICTFLPVRKGMTWCDSCLRDGRE